MNERERESESRWCGLKKGWEFWKLQVAVGSH